MKKVFFVMLVLLMGFALVSCDNANATVKEGVGYGLVHGHYVGEAKVKLKGSSITELTFEEYYLPYNAAQLKALSAWEETVPDNVVERSVTNASTNVTTVTYYAKYFYVDGDVYVGSLNSSNVIQYLKGTQNIEDWVKNEANAKAYVDAVKANKVYVIDSETATTKSSLALTGSAATGFTKSTTGYWPATHAVGIGWQANMDAIAATFISQGVEGSYTQNDDGNWTILDHVSGATVSDFADYQNLAKRAVSNAS